MLVRVRREGAERTNFYYVLGLETYRHRSVKRVRCKFVFVDECGSEKVVYCRKLQHERAEHAYLLTGSLIATRKSCACSAMGENASRMICPSSGLIHNGRDAWSSFRCSHEKSWSWNICETRLSCCRRCAGSPDESPPSSFGFLVASSFLVSAVKLIVAPRGMREFDAMSFSAYSSSSTST